MACEGVDDELELVGWYGLDDLLDDVVGVLGVSELDSRSVDVRNFRLRDHPLELVTLTLITDAFLDGALELAEDHDLVFGRDNLYGLRRAFDHSPRQQVYQHKTMALEPETARCFHSSLACILPSEPLCNRKFGEPDGGRFP